MRIALFHNLGSGGAKRHLFEQVRVLQAHGHHIDLFIPGDADEDFLPLAPFCEKVRVFGPKPIASQVADDNGGVPPQPSLARRIARSDWGKPVAETLWAAREERRLAEISRVQAEMAQEIDRGGYNVLYVYQCRKMLAPDLLRAVRTTPTLFCCNDTPRSSVEWPAETEPGYDTFAETPLRRKRLGRWLTPPLVRFTEHQTRRFETNTRIATRVLANSCYTRECIARLTGVDARVCYPGVDSEFFRPDPKAVRQRSVLAVGALLPSKRHDFVIRAVASLPAATRPMVEMIGYESRADGQTGVSGEGARLTALAAERGVALTIRREVSDAILRDAYQRAGVVAFAPYLEPFGLVAVEAAACGTPVVGVREGGVRETVADGETGFLTDRDPAAFAAAIARVLDEPALAARLGAAGRSVAMALWNWEKSAATAEAHLAEIADLGAGR